MQQPTYSVAALADKCGGRMINPAEVARLPVRGVATVQDAAADSITWITEPKHAKLVEQSAAAAIIGTSALLGQNPRGIVVDDPEAAIADVLELFHVPNEPPAVGTHPMAVVHPSARLGKNVAIGAHAVVGAEVEIGDESVVHPGVSIGRAVRIGQASILYDRCVIYDRCEIGNRVILHAGTVIGADGFGYIFRQGRHRRLAHLGNVVIEDDVEVGANTCIDRGKLAPTRIGRGSKIDDLVMVGHNVQIGPLCILAGQCGLSGSVQVGTGSVLGGQAGIAHGLRIGNQTLIGAQSGIISDVEDGQAVVGMPGQERVAFFREMAALRKLPELLKEFNRLSKRVAELEAAANHPKSH